MAIKKIISFFSVLGLMFTLAACTYAPWLYQVDVQQGNLITSDLVHQLHIGMSKATVCDILGPPILANTFNENRWVYTYTFKPGRGKCIERNLILYFRQNHISHIVVKNV